MKKILNNKLYFGLSKSLKDQVVNLKSPRFCLYFYFLIRHVNYHFSFRLFSCEFFFGAFDDLNTAIIDNWIHASHFGKNVGHVKFQNNFYFDEDFYISSYKPDLSSFDCALEHYLKDGWKSGFNPSKYFDTSFYIEQYSDYLSQDVNPFEYYLKVGFSKGHLPFFINFFHDLGSDLKPISTLPIYSAHNEANYSVPQISPLDICSNSYTVFCPLGLGDSVAIEPVFRYLRVMCSDCKIYAVFYKGQAEINKFNRNLDGVIILNKDEDIRELLYNIANKTTILNCVLHGTVFNCGKSRLFWTNVNNDVNISNYYFDNCILSALSKAAGIAPLYVKPYFWGSNKSYVKDINNYGKYILFHCKSAEKTRCWSNKNFNILANYYLDRGFKIIEIGSQQIIKSQNVNYINLTSKLDFHEIFEIIKHAYLFVCLDSVFLHFANCANTNTICIAGPVKTKYLNKTTYFYGQTPCSNNNLPLNSIKYCYPEKGKSTKEISVNKVIGLTELYER